MLCFFMQETEICSRSSNYLPAGERSAQLLLAVFAKMMPLNTSHIHSKREEKVY